MEPFDYPDNDPGPQTLLTTLAPSRISTGCTGTSADSRAMPGSPISWAARFVVADAVMQPIVREAAKRGLGYLDDGAAPRSVAPRWRRANRCLSPRPISRSTPCRPRVEIDRALVKLESLAKERGMAVGVASALPISIERIGTWIRTLESHGIMLVPLTTAMLKSKSG